MQGKNHKLIILQLNELNFDIVQQYVNNSHLPGFSRLLAECTPVTTVSEMEYHKLEPWIQWVSIQTGKSFQDHQVFRLGDIVHKPHAQIFEAFEKRGYRVGAISPMNARNDLNNPSYFIPDPWTQTEPDSSGFSRRLTEMLRQTVNDNAEGAISNRSKLTLLEAILRTLDLSGTPRLFRLILASRHKPWMKAMVLDQLIHLIHKCYINRRGADVSFVFFNAGAHVQHHYWFGSKFYKGAMKNPDWYLTPGQDPIFDMLQAYDAILMDYMKMHDQGIRLIVATGLTQVPYESVKFYYRLRRHADFLDKLGISYAEVHPRMTRDFEVTFNSENDIKHAKDMLERAHIERTGEFLFKELEIREDSLFVTLTYPHEIRSDDVLLCNDTRIPDVLEHMVFVAIKNGMHSGNGYAYFSKDCLTEQFDGSVPVASMFDLLLNALPRSA